MDTLKKRTVYLIGPQKLQNALIAYYLESRGAIRCADLAPDDVIPVPADGQARQPTLFLIDCFRGNIERCLEGFDARQKKMIFQHPVALFNLKPRIGAEVRGFPFKIRGFFYMCERPETLLEGIEAIFEGKLWISGEMKSRYMRGREKGPGAGNDHDRLLTHRELEILALVSEGMRNEQIAFKLCISSHTVKTHMYNMLKKIGVSNRRQAVLWAMINLPDLNIPANGSDAL